MDPSEPEIQEIGDEFIVDPFEVTDDEGDPEYTPDSNSRKRRLRSDTALINSEFASTVNDNSHNSLLDNDNAASISSSSSNLTICSQSQTSLPPLLDGTFFECVEQKGNKISAKCLKCLPKEKYFQGVTKMCICTKNYTIRFKTSFSTISANLTD